MRHTYGRVRVAAALQHTCDADGVSVTLFDDVQDALAGRYRLESEVGEGGSARVFAAHDLKHDRRVAIKVLKAEVALSLAGDRFLREIRIDARLHHPRILPLYDSGEVVGLPYFVMPFVEGETLRTRLAREHTLPVADAVRITMQVADALTYLHEQGLVHRDVKPENILLSAGEHVWLADFGIARALQDAIIESVTATGTAIGTPAYMSPEQRMGVDTIDGQSDQFSLAIVLYEMLTGKPPTLFEKAGELAAPGGPRVTPTRSLRTDVPKQLDEVIARALQIDERARWPSVRDFATRLAESTSLTPVSTMALRRPRRSLAWIGGAVGVGALLVLGTQLQNRETAPTLDALKVVVLPLAHEGDGSLAFLDGDDCSRFLREAVARWRGIHRVDDMELRDVRVQLGRPESVLAAMRMAKELGAGLAIWGVVGPPLPGGASAGASAPVSPRAIRIYLYDVARGAVHQQASGTIDPTGDFASVFQQLADSLLVGAAVGGAPPMPMNGSRDLNAVRAYLDGHRALDAFNLPVATAAFRRAIAYDANYALPYLWLAWTTLWSPDADARAWGNAAARALEVGNGLTAHDSVHALALVRMQERRNDEACDLYRTLLRRDANDFAAWYGLGECLSSDVAVVPSATSKSGYQFRSSMHEAIGAYERAIALVPRFTDAMGQRALTRLQRWMYVQPNRYRPGRGPDSSRFAAWPSLSGDSLAFIPFNERAVFAESSGTREPTYLQALQRNRDRLLVLVNNWVALDANNVLALEVLALAREANDELLTLRRAESGVVLTGMTAIQRARAVATGEPALRLGTTHVRFLLKVDRVAEARALADSLLRMPVADSANAVVAGHLHVLAMLTGRVSTAIAWGRRSATYQFHDPIHPEHSVSPMVTAAAADAATFAAMGAPPDSIRAALTRLERALVGLSGPSLELVRQLFVEDPVLLAWPALGHAIQPSTRTSAGNPWLPMQLAIGRGDLAAARAALERVEADQTRMVAQNTWAFDYALVATQIWLALGDSARALRLSASVLDQTRTSNEQLLRHPTATAGYVRLLVRRSALAAARGDTAQARAWGRRAWTLWRDADPMLAEVMRPIARWRDSSNPGGTR